MTSTDFMLLLFLVACLLFLLAIVILVPSRREYTQDTTTHRNGRDYHDPLYALPPLFLTLWLAACSSPTGTPNDCTTPDGLVIVPTATLAIDPDLSIPPLPPLSSGDSRVYCATPTPAAATDAPTHYATGQLVNLSLDRDDQSLLAAAAGDDMLAIAWRQIGELHLALARGANALQVRRMDKGETMSLAFSPINRLHVAYEKNGEIYYRYADQGVHPADRLNESIASGRSPVIVLDRRNYAHIVYEQDSLLYHAAQVQENNWQINPIMPGTAFTAAPIRGRNFGYLVSYQDTQGQIHLARWSVDETTGFLLPIWNLLTTIPPITGQPLTGPAYLDYYEQGDAAWAYAAWVTIQPAAQPANPAYGQPGYAAANPLYPYGLANPQYIHAGLNAVIWGTNETPFQAGLYQTFPVTQPGQPLTISAYGLADAAAASDLTLRLGLDPTGGTNAAATSVIWSDPSTPVTFQSFSLTSATSDATATVFLEATTTIPHQPATAVWDSVDVDNGSLSNPDFEEAFLTQSTLIVPEGWTAYYQDSGNQQGSGRDLYTVYAVWSADGGNTWSAAAPMFQNRETSGSLTGAFQPQAYPLISLATDPPSVTFTFIYSAGDPPPGSDFQRFGRPYQGQCELGTTHCTDHPGTPLLPRLSVRPARHLLLTRDLLIPGRAVLVWDSLQLDYRTHDVLATYLVLR